MLFRTVGHMLSLRVLHVSRVSNGKGVIRDLSFHRNEQAVSQPLMVAFLMIMLQEFMNAGPQRSFAEGTRYKSSLALFAGS
jgi:hypothetical protein